MQQGNKNLYMKLLHICYAIRMKGGTTVYRFFWSLSAINQDSPWVKKSYYSDCKNEDQNVRNKFVKERTDLLLEK